MDLQQLHHISQKLPQDFAHQLLKQVKKVLIYLIQGIELNDELS